MQKMFYPLLQGIAGVGMAMSHSAPAWPQVGIVRTVEGVVNVASGRQECAPRYGLDLEEGDAVRTGAKAWALLTMMDGTKITVRPDSEMRILAYRYTDAGEFTQNQALLALTTGALRVVTGRIAAGPNTGFRVQTPDATLELRGTDHDVSLIEPKTTLRGDAPAGTYGKAYAGEAMMKNSRGEVAVRTGQIAYAEPKMRAAPRALSGTEPYFYYWHDYIDRRAAAVAEKLEATFVP
jgi:hypothetical protein